MLEPAIQDKRRWWSREDLLFLVLFGCFFFLPGILLIFPGQGQIPLFDRDEPRFATAAREMIQHNDYLVPHFNGQLRPDKPPLVYWLMDAAHAATGGWSELGARLPSAICSTLTLIVLYFMVGARFGRVTGLIAALILGSCAVFIVESRLATADATMLFFIVTCMACAWQAWDAGGSETGSVSRHLPRTDYLLDRGDGNIVLDHLPKTARRRMPVGMALLFWVSLAGGALTKGVPLIFVLVPMIVLSIATGTLATELRQWRAHLHVTGARIAIALGIAAAATAIVATGVDWRWWAVILGILLIGMILTPGLPGVVFRCITGGNWRWWRQLRPLWGVPLLIALIAAWVVPVAMRQPELLTQMVGVHFLQRSAGPLLKWLHISIPDTGSIGGNDAMGSYAKPPGFYLLMIWITFWPWSILLVPATYHTVRRLRGKTAITIDPRPYQFLVAWIVPMWILLELARGKLLHYPLPTYVAIAILCADALVQGWHRLTDVLAPTWFAEAKWAMLLIWCGLAAAVLIGAKRYLDPELFWYCVPLAGALVAVGVAGTTSWNRPSWPFVTVLAWGAALLIANSLVLSNIKPLRVSKLAGSRMAELHDAYPNLHLAALGYEEPSLIFYAGDHVDLFDGPSTMQASIPFGPNHPPDDQHQYVIAIDDATLKSLHLRNPSLQFYRLGHYEGFDVANKKPVSITLITNVLLPHEYAGTASEPATLPATP